MHAILMGYVKGIEDAEGLPLTYPIRMEKSLQEKG